MDKEIIVVKEPIENINEYKYLLGMKGGYRRDQGDFFESITPCEIYPELEDIPVYIKYTGPKIDKSKWNELVNWLCDYKKRHNTEVAANIYWNKDKCSFYIRTDEQVVTSVSVDTEILKDKNLMFLGNVHVHPDGFHGFSGIDHNDNTVGFQISINTDGSVFCDYMAYRHRVEGDISDLLDVYTEAEVELDLDESRIKKPQPVFNQYKPAIQKQNNYYQFNLFEDFNTYEDPLEEDDDILLDILDSVEDIQDYTYKSVCVLCGKGFDGYGRKLLTINDEEIVIHNECFSIIENFIKRLRGI